MARHESGRGPVAHNEAASTPVQAVPGSQPSAAPEAGAQGVPEVPEQAGSGATPAVTAIPGSGGATPGGAAPGGAAPGGAAPGGATAGGRAPGSGAPGGVAPGGGVAGSAVPGDVVPGGVVPGGVVPGGVVPGGGVPAQIEPSANPDALQPTAPPAPLAKSATEPAPRSRVGGIWVAAVLFALILLLLLIFVLENGQSTEISFFGQHGHLPEGVALLLAAVCGILLVAIPGTARIVQLRIRDRHYRKAKAAATDAALAPESTMDARSQA
jgi:uncharacterized integral membrane protein